MLAAAGSSHVTTAGVVSHLWPGHGHPRRVPGWAYSMVVALQTGRHSWTAPLDARRLAPGDDAAAVTATQLPEVVERLTAAGQWQPGDPDIWIVADAGYDGPRLAWQLADLPVRVLVRMRSDRVLRRGASPRSPGVNGRPPRHGAEFIFKDPAAWDAPDRQTVVDTRLYGTATARAWNQLHLMLAHRTAWSADTKVCRSSRAP
jgi:DDE superfamily endonuclease